MFEFKKDAEIRAINIAKGSNDESPVVVTIGLKFEGLSAAPVAASLGCPEDDLDLWFNDSGELRFNGVTNIQTWAEYEDQHQVKMLGFVCDVSKISAIKIRPYGNKLFELNCNIQLQNPPDHVIEKVAASLHGSKPVELIQEAQLDLGATSNVHEMGTR